MRQLPLLPFTKGSPIYSMAKIFLSLTMVLSTRSTSGILSISHSHVTNFMGCPYLNSYDFPLIDHQESGLAAQAGLQVGHQ